MNISLFSSINNSSRIDKLLDESALFRDGDNPTLKDSNIKLIEKNILAAKEGTKAVRVLSAITSANTTQSLENRSTAGSILTSSNIGIFNNLYGGPYDKGYGNNDFGNSRSGGYGYGNSGYSFTSNIFSALI